MKTHCHLILILAIAYSLPGLLSYTAQTKAKSADEARAAQVNERSERRSLAERSLDGNPRFDLHFNHLASPALSEAGWTRSLAISPQASTNFIVNSTADPGTGVCDDAECTLREAITAANAHAGTDTIAFNIPGAGPHTIRPTSTLPSITSPVTIDGYTQPGASANTEAFGDNAVLTIELDGSLGGTFGSPSLLSIGAGSSIVRGLVINRGSALYGISIDTNGGNTIEGDFIGTDIAGDAVLGNNQGVIIQFGSSNNLIGGTTPAARNIISGNSDGISLSGGTGNMVEGNFIGTDHTGSNDLGNTIGIGVTASSNNTIGGTLVEARNVISGNGTEIRMQADNNVIQGNYIGISVTGGAFNYSNTSVLGINIFNSTGNTIGGLTSAARNVISGHSIGISLNSTPSTTVQGNFIGTDAAGTARLGNTSIGINVQSSNNTVIGGTATGAGNLISANGTGIQIAPGSGTAIQIQGNLIGTDVNGTADLGNTGDGVSINDSAFAANVTIGGTDPAARNVISGNDGDGISLRGVTGTVVQGNLIGTGIDGVSPLGNSGHGVHIAGTSNNTIGGTSAGAGNRVAFNGASNTFGGGVIIESSTSTNNSVRGNSVFANTCNGTSANGGLGIDLSSSGSGNGPTLNDACDGDVGPNNLQNFPVLSFSGGILSGTLDSTANTTFVIEFFSNASPDSSGFGEGQTFLRSITVGTDAMCNASFNDVRFSTNVPAGQWITATATDPNGNTSEFSQAVLLTGPTATNGSISGRITDANGRPVEGAAVRMSGTQSRLTITDSNGNYNFFDVETNGFYTVTPSRVNYTFSPPNRSFSLLGLHTEASFTATSNGGKLNPLDTIEYFVRQQYLDFLGREPDPPGFIGWVNTINNCAPNDTSCDRVHVSEMFFRSQEFQERGYFAYRFYSTAFGRKPDYAEFVPDMVRVSGFLTNDQLEAAKTAFIDDFMARPGFAGQYNRLSNSAYVDALIDTAGVNLSNRLALIDALNAGTQTKAQVLRQITESGEVYQKYYNQAFVVMEYFGYLRRDPDALYLNWIDVLNEGGDSRYMVNGFVNSAEYRQRFGP